MEHVETRIVRARAANAVDHTRSLLSQDPGWGSQVHAIADGWLVLAGPGMYINQAMAVGLRAAVTVDELDIVFSASAEVGVAPAIEITSATTPGTRGAVVDRGLLLDRDADIACLSRSVAGPPIDAPADVVVRPVESPDDLRLWQATARSGWGHASPDARRASDAFAAAAHAVDGERMTIAHDAEDGRILGCASMTVTDGVAMCGGMSTLPTERRRGVQAAMLRYRLALAADLGCDLAMATAAGGSASERNLRRHGFSGDSTIQRFALPGT